MVEISFSQTCNPYDTIVKMTILLHLHCTITYDEFLVTCTTRNWNPNPVFMNCSRTPPPLLATNSAPSVLNRQKVVVRPDPSFMRFDSSESDNEDYSQFPGKEGGGGGGDSRKTSRETPKSRPVPRRPPKRVQFGPQDEPDEDEAAGQPRQLIGADRRHTLSHIDLSNVEEFYGEEEEDDDDGGDSEASRRRRRRLVDSVSSLLDLGGPRVTHVTSVGHPVVAFLMGTRRSIKRRRRGGGLTVSNLLRDRRVRIGSMTNLSSSSSTPRSSSPCYPPPVSLSDSIDRFETTTERHSD